jgi:hypothetical protein
MGYMFQWQGGIYLAYELESEDGNTVALRYYSNLTLLQKNNYEWEVQLAKSIQLPEAPDTVALNKTKVHNIGTPSINSVSDCGTVIEFKFHYLPEHGSEDLPGQGTIWISSFQDGGSWEDYPNWAGAFSNQVNNAVTVASGGIVAKIGQRANIVNPQSGQIEYYIYEAQQYKSQGNADWDKERWLSWRAVLYNPGIGGNAEAVIIPFNIMGLQSFANPHSAILGNRLYLGFFIPSEVTNSTLTSQYDRLPADQCATCAHNPMTVPDSQVQTGSLLFSVPLSLIWR